MSIRPPESESKPNVSPKPQPGGGSNKPDEYQKTAGNGADVTTSKEENSRTTPGAPENEDQIVDSAEKVHSDKNVISSKPARPSTPVTKSSSIAGSISANSHRSAEEFFSMTQRLPIQIFNQETRLQKLSHWGPMVTSVASIVLTLFVWFSAQKLTSQQVQLQREQVQAELADMRFKFLNEVTATDDERKKVPAEIALAAHGPEARPVVYLAMGVEQVGIRKSAVNVFSRMFLAALTLKERNTLLEELLGQFKSFNKTLHVGVMQAIVKIGPLLYDAERQKVIAFLQESVPPQSVCVDSEGRDTVKEAAAVFWAEEPNSIPYVLDIIRNPKCGDGWLQAIVKLESIAEKQPERRAELLTTIKQIKEEVLRTLEENVKDEDLISGGYDSFIKKGQNNVNLFKKRVEDEFNRLSQSLGEQ